MVCGGGRGAAGGGAHRRPDGYHRLRRAAAQRDLCPGQKGRDRLRPAVPLRRRPHQLLCLSGRQPGHRHQQPAAGDAGGRPGGLQRDCKVDLLYSDRNRQPGRRLRHRRQRRVCPQCPGPGPQNHLRRRDSVRYPDPGGPPGGDPQRAGLQGRRGGIRRGRCKGICLSFCRQLSDDLLRVPERQGDGCRHHGPGPGLLHQQHRPV